MPTLLGIHGTVTNPGRLSRALQVSMDAASTNNPFISTSFLHLGDHKISFADGRPADAYGDDTGTVL